ncbi:hypothetical protein AB0300_14920 [Microbacterium sp. NPDC078814]|uniref:hypothetical protein n=1 Tax=Microbacterium sp. NPDC078814 TaxID=3154767 RepID=UPI00344B4633
MYATTKISRIDGDSIRALTEIPRILSENGVKVPKDVLEATARHAEIVAKIKVIGEGTDSDSAQQSAARALADGTATPEQVTLAAAAQSIAQRDPSSPYQKILNQGRDMAAQDLKTVLAEHGEKWITGIIRPALKTAITTLSTETAHAPEYDAFRDPNAAEHWLSNPRVVEAWEAITGLYEVARRLRRYRIVPAAQRRNDWFEWAGDGEYHERRGGDHLIASLRENMRPDNLTWFLMGMQYGMQPTIHTDAEAAAEQARSNN